MNKELTGGELQRLYQLFRCDVTPCCEQPELARKAVADVSRAQRSFAFMGACIGNIMWRYRQSLGLGPDERSVSSERPSAFPKAPPLSQPSAPAAAPSFLDLWVLDAEWQSVLKDVAGSASFYFPGRAVPREWNEACRGPPVSDGPVDILLRFLVPMMGAMDTCML